MNETQVRPLFMEKQELLKHKAMVTKVGLSEINKKKYKWIQLDETIFHPKGGGQPSDEGFINEVPVIYVHKILQDKNVIDQFEILHCFDETQEISFQVGDEARLEVDVSKRSLHSKMHTAGHVLAASVNDVFPELEGFHGNHDPKDGYVKFKMLREFGYGKEEIIRRAQPQLHSNLQRDLLVVVTKLPSGMRAIQIGEQVMPCGGTHVPHLRDVGSVEITDATLNYKEKTVTIKYRL